MATEIRLTDLAASGGCAYDPPAPTMATSTVTAANTLTNFMCTPPWWERPDADAATNAYIPDIGRAVP